MKRKLLKYTIIVSLVTGFLWFWLSGRLFSPLNNQTIELTVFYSDGSPVQNAILQLEQGGERIIIPIPFSGMSWRSESSFSQTTNAAGFCRIEFNEQICHLNEILIGDTVVEVKNNRVYQGGGFKELNASLPSWHSTTKPIIHQIFVERPELSGVKHTQPNQE